MATLRQRLTRFRLVRAARLGFAGGRQVAARPRWAAGIGLLALVLFGPGLVQIIWLNLRERTLERRMAVLRAQHEQLAAERQRLQTDATYQEGLIRSTFKQARPGELVIPLDGPLDRER